MGALRGPLNTEGATIGRAFLISTLYFQNSKFRQGRPASFFNFIFGMLSSTYARPCDFSL